MRFYKPVKVPESSGGSGVELPTLTNPGSASDVVSGKEVLDGAGNLLTGSHVCSGGGGVPVLFSTVLYYGSTITCETITVEANYLYFILTYDLETQACTERNAVFYSPDGNSLEAAGTCHADLSVGIENGCLKVKNNATANFLLVAYKGLMPSE